MKTKTAKFHPQFIEVSEFPIALRNEFRNFSVNTHDKKIMHFGYADLVWSIMKRLKNNGFEFEN